MRYLAVFTTQPLTSCAPSDALSEIEVGTPQRPPAPPPRGLGRAAAGDDNWRRSQTPDRKSDGAGGAGGVYDSIGGLAHRGPSTHWGDEAGNASPPIPLPARASRPRPNADPLASDAARRPDHRAAGVAGLRAWEPDASVWRRTPLAAPSPYGAQDPAARPPSWDDPGGRPYVGGSAVAEAMWSWPVAHRLLHAGCCKQAILHTGCCTQATARRLLRTQAHAGIVPPADPEALACALVAPADPETRRHERAPHSLPHPRRPSRTRRDGAWCLACALDLAWVRGPHAPLVGRPSREDAIDALTGLSRHGPTMKREMGQTRDTRCRHSKARPCFTGRP